MVHSREKHPCVHRGRSSDDTLIETFPVDRNIAKFVNDERSKATASEHRYETQMGIERRMHGIAGIHPLKENSAADADTARSL
jgi:hypothetical protein